MLSIVLRLSIIPRWQGSNTRSTFQSEESPRVLSRSFRDVFEVRIVWIAIKDIFEPSLGDIEEHVGGCMREERIGEGGFAP